MKTMTRDLIILVLLVGICSCTTPEKEATKPTIEQKNLLVLCYDSMNWHVLLPMIRMGKMPCLERIIAQSAYANLKTFKPTLSDLIWTSIATGQVPDDHGITAVQLPDPVTHELIPVTSTMRKSAAMWNILHQYGISSLFIKWLVTWPIEPARGIHISDRFKFVGLENRAYPRSIEEIPTKKEIGLWTGPDFSPAQVLKQNRTTRYHFSYLQDWGVDDYSTFKEGLYYIDKYAPQVTTLFFWGLDRIQHNFFEYLYTPQNKLVWQPTAQVIPSYYEFYDAIAAQVLATNLYENLVILSDHGMVLAKDPNKMMIMQQVKEGQKKFDVKKISMNRLLQKIGLQKADSETYIDWSQTYAWEPDAVMNPELRKIVLNVQGQQPYGIIPQQESQARTQQIIESLKTLTSETEHLPLLSECSVNDDNSLLCKLNTAVPDNATFSYGENRFTLQELIAPVITGSGQHPMAPPGILIISGSSIKHGVIHHASVWDICPTELMMLNLPIAQDMDGKALTEIFSEEYRQRYKQTPVPHYELHRAESQEPIKTSIDEELREGMRQLGYIQ